MMSPAMKRTLGRCVHGSDRFGLNKPGDWTRLGSIPVLMQIDVWKEPGPGIYRVPMAQRRAFMRKRILGLRSRLVRAMGLDVLTPPVSKSDPRWIRVRVSADRVPELSRRPEVNSLTLETIPGHRARSVKKARRMEWYAVKAKFAIKVEGVTSGWQSWEERIVLVRADGFKDAERRAMREFKRYESSFLGTGLRRVRWEFEEVVEIYHTFLDSLDPSSTEVWSKIRRRRLVSKARERNRDEH